MMDRSSTLILSPSTTLKGVWEELRQTTSLETSNVMLVTYGHSPEAVRDAWRAQVGKTPKRLGIIGVGIADRHTDGESVSATDEDVLTTVRDPSSASDLGIAISLYLEDWATDDTPTIFGFHSVSSMLEHVGLETAFRFLHVLTRRLAGTETSGRFYLDPNVIDEQTVETLRPVFETVIEHEQPAEDPITPDIAFDLLQSERRRYILYHLLESSDETSVEALVSSVGHREETIDHDRVEMSIRHTHLPKLEDAGVVSSHLDRIIPHGSLAALKPYLSSAVAHDLPDEDTPF